MSEQQPQPADECRAYEFIPEESREKQLLDNQKQDFHEAEKHENHDAEEEFSKVHCFFVSSGLLFR